MATACQAGPCPATLLGFPIQLCKTSTECFVSGQTCSSFTVPGLGITITDCSTPDGGTSGEGGMKEGGEGSASSSGGGEGGSESGSDAPTGG